MITLYCNVTQKYGKVALICRLTYGMVKEKLECWPVNSNEAVTISVSISKLNEDELKSLKKMSNIKF